MAGNGRLRVMVSLRDDSGVVKVNLWDFAGILDVGTPELLELWSNCGSKSGVEARFARAMFTC